MAEAQFIPGGPASAIPNALNTGLETGLSMMDRASRRRMAEEAHALQMQQQEILRPVREAQGRADLAAAKNKLASMEQIEGMRAAAHEEMPQIRAEWEAASQLNDPMGRSDAQNKVLGRATKYEMVAELKPEVDRMKEVWSTGHITARTLANTQGITERQTELANIRAQAKAEADAAAGELKKQLAEQKAEADRLKQELVNKGKKDVATTRAGGQYEHLLRSYQDAVEAGDEETASLLDAQIKKRNHIAQPYSDAERIKTLDAEAKAAEADGDAALAKSLRDRIGYLTRRSGGAAKSSTALRDAILGAGTQNPTGKVAPPATKPGTTIDPKFKF
jgi:colicin import membrane protein